MNEEESLKNDDDLSIHLTSERLEIIPLSGILSEKALSYLIEIDDRRILLDCGWNDDFNLRDLDHILKVARTIDLIIISHSDLQHCGALPVIIKDLKNTAKILLTSSCAELTILTLFDIFINIETTQGFEKFDVDDIESLRQRMVVVNFNERVNLSELLTDDTDMVVDSSRSSKTEVIIERAGRTLGGGCVKIKRGEETLLYAVDFNHKKESSLCAADFIKNDYMQDVSVLITDAYDYERNNVVSTHRKEDVFLTLILQKLRQGGSVLVPCSLARMPELLLLLEQEWNKRKLTYNLVLASPIARSFVRMLKANLEFMEEGLNQDFVNTRINPFDLKFTKTVTEMREIEHVREPRVILCTSETLEHGFSKRLFVDFADQKRSLVLFPEKTLNPLSLGRKLSELSHSNTVFPHVKIRLNKWVYNSPAEVQQWRDQQKERALAEERHRLQREQERLLTEELMISQTESKSAVVSSLSLAKILSEKAKKISSTVFSASEPERFIHFNEFGQIPNESEQENRVQLPQAGLKPESKAKSTGDLPDKMTEETFLEYDFGNVLVDATLPRDFRTRLPRKNAAEDILLFIKCDVKFVDLSGRSDSRSIKFLIEKLQPRKVVLIHAKSRDCQMLMSNLSKVLPKNNQIIIPDKLSARFNISSQTKSWEIVVDPALLSRKSNLLYSAYVKADFEVGYLDGLITNASSPDNIEAETPQPKTEQSKDDEVSNVKSINIPTLVPLDFTNKLDVEATDNNSLTFWNDLEQRRKRRRGLQRSWRPNLLSHGGISIVSIQKNLEEQGIKSRFWEGALHCDDNVRITKSDKDSLEISCCLSKSFHQIQSAIKRQFIEL